MLNINLEGLEDKWSLISHENCCVCGMNFEENDECPLRLWKDHESPDCKELALCWDCGKKRMSPDTKVGDLMKCEGCNKEFDKKDLIKRAGKMLCKICLANLPTKLSMF